MKKRLLSFAVAFCMVLSLLPAAAFAEENAEASVCICEEACTAEAMNVSCPVCGAEGASVESCCKYTAPAVEDPEGGVTPEPTAPPVCTCEEACTAEAMNVSCPVCGAEGASLESCCKYTAPGVEDPEGGVTPEPTSPPVCTCEEACTAGAMNVSCPVCGAEGASLENCCKYTAPAAEDPELTAVEKAQALIDALPMVEDLKNADEETVDAVYAAVQAACDALDELTTEELEQVTCVEKLAALLEWLNGPVSTFTGATDAKYFNFDSGTGTITGLTSEGTTLEEIVIPAKIGDVDVTAIGDYAFRGCTSLKSITIPDGVTTIGEGAFFVCTSLESITIPGSVTTIGDGAFNSCSSLESITIPDGVTTIVDYAFGDCSSLKSITIPDGVTTIGEYAFSYCSSLKSITIPDGVTTIGNYAFQGCSSLKSITIPDGVTTIGDYAFQVCSSLESITILDGVATIGKYTFADCTSLTRITIPNSVTNIYDYAFKGCSGLTDVYYLGTEAEWGNIKILDYGNGDLTGNSNAKVRYLGDITQGFSFTPPSNLTYDGEAKEATVTKNNQDYGAFIVKYYDQNGQVYTAGPVNAGTYTVKIDIEDSEGYDAISDYEVGRFTILQAENSFTTPLSIEDWTYGDTPNAPDSAAKFGTPTYSYSTQENGTYDETTQPTTPGTYWIKAVVEGTDNYTGLEAKKQFRILPKTYTVTYAAGSNGSGTVTAGSKTHDVAFTLSSDTFTRAGYKQTGWAASDGGEKAYDLGGTYTENKDITLYPVWSDAQAPVISGIENGKTYCEAQTVSVSDNDAIEKVTVNDEEVSLDENSQFILSPSEETQTIAATDKAGNSTTFAITINDGHRDADNNHLCDFCQALLFDCNEGDTPGHNCILLHNPTEMDEYASGDWILVRYSLHNNAQDGDWVRSSLIDRDGKEIRIAEVDDPGLGEANILVPENLEMNIYTLRVSLMHKDETDAESKEICSTEVRIAINFPPIFEYDKTIDYQTGLTYDVKEMFPILHPVGFENAGYSMQYSLTGGTGEGTLTGSKLTVTKPGTFLVKALVKNWYIGLSGKEYEATATLTVTAYDITYDLDGGTAAGNPAYYGAGDTVTLTAPEKEGFEFLGWSGTDLTGSDNRTVTIPLGSRGERHYTAHWLDTEKPTGKITAGADSWDTFSAGVTFKRFYKEARTVTIQGNDNSKEAVGIEYLLSDRELTESELAAKTFKAYGGAFLIEPDHEWIIYAKLTDPAGNTRYINSDGIVLDAAAPVISGIENGKTYCAAQTVTVSDRYDVTVTVNGSPVPLTDGKFTLSPAEGTQTVTAADKAGNQAEMTVTVNEGHTCEWQSENGKYWKKCKYCGDETEKKDIPAITINGADAVCMTQDYSFSFTLPEGVADAACGYEFADSSSKDLAPTIENGRMYAVIPVDLYESEGSSFKVYAIAKTDDGFEFSVSKTVALQRAHTDTEPEDHKCDTCGETVSECRDENPADHKCDICGAILSECKDENPKDHKCDICGATLSKCKDENPKDHKCDICEATLSEHTGGEATCKDQAICEYCGEAYGDLDPDNHTGGTEIRDAKEASCTEAGYTGDTYCKGCKEKLSEGEEIAMLAHKDEDNDHLCDVCGTRISECEDKDPKDHKCDICGATLSECEDINPKDHKCDICGATLSEHTGGTATCKDKAVCEYCGEAYGDLDSDNHTGGTEIRDAKEASCTEAGYTGDTYCKGCGEKLSEGEEIAMLAHKDEDNDHLCDVCKTRISECKDENPKDHKCDICGVTLSECEDENPKDHKCDTCGATLSEHTGGTATCKAQAVCEYCGEAYGETDSSRHDLEKVPAKAATVTETGNIEYWQCKDCGDIFSDPDGKNKIGLEDTVLEKLPPEIIEGKGQSMTEGEKKALSFKSNAAFSDFIGVEIDGRTLDEKDYTATEGSTVVTLKEDYAAALPAGEHTIGIVSANGTASTAFTVTAKKTETEKETSEMEKQTETVSSGNDSQQTAAKPAETETAVPATGDETPLGMMIGLMIGALALILAVLFLRRRGRR